MAGVCGSVDFWEYFKIIANYVGYITRSPLAPNVPTLAELGYKDVDVGAWQGIMGPKGMPADVVKALNTHFSITTHRFPGRTNQTKPNRGASRRVLVQALSVASRAARNAGVTSGSTPNQASNAGLAWFSSMPRPLTVGLPRSRAAAKSGVSSGT